MCFFGNIRNVQLSITDRIWNPINSDSCVCVFQMAVSTTILFLVDSTVVGVNVCITLVPLLSSNRQRTNLLLPRDNIWKSNRGR